MSKILKTKYSNNDIISALAKDDAKIESIVERFKYTDTDGKIKYDLEKFGTTTTTVEQNEFLTALFNKIGRQRIFDPMKDFDNPYSFLFRDGNSLASSEEELSVELLDDKDYDGTATNPYTQNKPTIHVQQVYDTIKKYWKVTTSQAIVRRAFINEYGLEDFLALVQSRLAKSRDVFMYNETIALLKTIDKTYNISPIVSTGDADGARIAYEELIKMVNDLAIPSTAYNVNKQDAVLGKGKGILVLNSTYKASFDVNVLASLLNSNEIGANKYFDRVIVMKDDSFDENCIGYYFDRDAVILVNDLFRTDSLYNPETLTTNFWLHNWYKKFINNAVDAVKLINSTTPVTKSAQAHTEVEVEAPTKVEIEK